MRSNPHRCRRWGPPAVGPASSVPSAIAILLLAACGNGLDDLSLKSEPLVTVRGHVDLASIAPTAPLRAALVWGAVPNYNLACVKYASNAELQAYCPDPFGFFPGSIDADVAITSGDGTFAIPLDHLPSASVSVGAASSNIAWGSVIVAADLDGDSTFDLLTTLGDRVQNKLADAAVAASFFSLHAPQQRIAFREGAWNAQSIFYPLSQCEPPPVGYSVLATPGFLEPALDPAPGTCTRRALAEVVVELTPLTVDQAKGLACRMNNRAPVRRPGATDPTKTTGPAPTQTREICLDAQTLAVVSLGSDCPLITVYALAACAADLVCSKPEWDLTQAPPTWWPCGP